MTDLAKIQEAGEWLAPRSRADLHRAIVPELMDRFGLTVSECIEAIAHAAEIRKEVDHGRASR